jgi:hypothetical protein
MPKKREHKSKAGKRRDTQKKLDRIISEGRILCFSSGFICTIPPPPALIQETPKTCRRNDKSLKGKILEFYFWSERGSGSAYNKGGREGVRIF